MENILPDFSSFQAEDYEAISSHWNLARSIVPPVTPPRLLHILPPRRQSAHSIAPVVESQLLLPAPNERYAAPVVSASSPSPLSEAQRGKCEEFALVLEQNAQSAARSQKATARADGRRESKLSVWNMLGREFTLFVQRKTMPASWEIAASASQDVILLGDHHTKVDSAPVGLVCCVGAAATTIRPSLQEVVTVVVPFLPEQLGLHVQFLEEEQAVIVSGVLEESQAADFEQYVLGARILAVNDFAISNLDDFGQKVQTAVNSRQDMVISFLPRFVSVPGIDKFDSMTDLTRRTSYRSRQMSKRLDSYSSQQESPRNSPSRQGSSLGSDRSFGEEEYASFMAAKVPSNRNAPPAGWEFATGGGMDVVEEAEPQEPLSIFSDSVRRYVQNVPDTFYQSVHSNTSCILMFSNFSLRHVMEVYWCNYDGMLQRKATLVTGQSHRSEGTAGQVWLLVAIPRTVQTVAEYQRSAQSQSRRSSSSASPGEVLLVQAHKSMISTLNGYTGMWAPTANNLSFVRRGRSASSASATAPKLEAPHLTVHLVCPKHEHTQEPQR